MPAIPGSRLAIHRHLRTLRVIVCTAPSRAFDGNTDVKKAYLVVAYQSVSDAKALADYAELAVPAILAAGGRPLVNATPHRIYELGLPEKTVIIEFDSATQAEAAFESTAYRKALEILGDAAERDVRIVEAIG